MIMRARRRDAICPRRSNTPETVLSETRCPHRTLLRTVLAVLQDLAATIEAHRDDPSFGQSWGYHSRVSIDRRYVYMAVPKVACTTVKRTLLDLEGLGPMDSGTVHQDDRQLRLARLDPTQATTALQSDDWMRFAFVRNPYDRMFSAWKSKLANTWDTQYLWLRQAIRAAFDYPNVDDGSFPMVAFGDFVRFIAESQEPRVVYDGHWNLQTAVLLPDVIAYDVIGRFETFVDDFTAVLRRIDAPPGVLTLAAEVTNSTPQLPLVAAYDRDLAEIVYRFYERDLETFGYNRDSWLLA
jgi:hypothetical protein